MTTVCESSGGAGAGASFSPLLVAENQNSVRDLLYEPKAGFHYVSKAQKRYRSQQGTCKHKNP